MSTYSIEAHKLSKSFAQYKMKTSLFYMPCFKKNTFWAVKNVDLQIKKGEIFCLVGPNGAGKTTLLKMLCGLIIPTNGYAKICGYDVAKCADKIKLLTGMASFMENSFFNKLTVKQNLMFFSALYNLDPKQAKSKISQIVETLDMESHVDVIFQNLSVGMKQRLAVARSLLNSFELLFLDEPTKSLDATIATRLRDFLKKIVKEQKTIFYITHNLKEAEEFSHRIAIMDKGEIKICGNLQEIERELGVVNKGLEQIFNYYASS